MKQKKYLLILTFSFFAIMIVFTYISHNIATSALPKVETVRQVDNMEISKESILTEPDGNTYIYVIDTEPSILGEQYIAVKTKIKIVKSKDTTCQIDTGDRLYEIIIDPGKDIYNGVRVRKE